MATLLATSVPPRERVLAEMALPGGRIVDAPLSDALAAPDVRVLSVSYADRLDPATLERFPALEAIVTRSDGFDHMPAEWMRGRGVAGYHLSDYAADAVARLTLGFLLALARRMPEARARTRAGTWERAGLEARDLPDLTVGILGVGRIGSRVAAMLGALGVPTLGYDLAPGKPTRFASSLEELLRGSDALTIHVPLTDATRGMIGAREIAMLRQGALLVNTARGDVVDQAAVEAALRDGRLAGYAADVLPGEPRPEADLARFAALPNVILTPHLGAYDARSIRLRHERSGAIARAVVAGRAADVAGWRCA